MVQVSSNEGRSRAVMVELFNRMQSDAAFAERVERDPEAVLRDYQIPWPEVVQLRVVRDTNQVRYVHIPSAPTEGEISDAELLQAQGGTT